MKIYIMGPPGSGKSTLAKELARRNKTNYYELDLLVFDDEHDHVRRSDDEIQKRFKKILKEKDWVIEDIGRAKFEDGKKEADILYYINLSKFEVYKRLNLRWLKQRLGKESYNYPPTLFQLWDMNRTARSYYKKEKKKLEVLNNYKDKVIYLSKKELNNLYSED